MSVGFLLDIQLHDYEPTRGALKASIELYMHTVTVIAAQQDHRRKSKDTLKLHSDNIRKETVVQCSPLNLNLQIHPKNLN